MTAKAIFDSIFNLKGTSCIIITHQLDDDVLDKCDCIYVMKNGQLMLSFFEDNSKYIEVNMSIIKEEYS